jgi:hypothetical protein
MRSLDKFSKKAKASNNAFVPIFSSALFLGMLSVLSMPHAANMAKPTGILSFVTAAVTALLCNKAAKATKISAIGEFSLPISLILGMVMAIVFTQFTV